MKTCFNLFGIECNKGWQKLYLPLIKLCQDNNIQITQIKEKYGGLRFYVGAAPEWLWRKIDQAEKDSYKTCELCGEPGKLRGVAWVQTLCDKCNEKNTMLDKNADPKDFP